MGCKNFAWQDREITMDGIIDFIINGIGKIALGIIFVIIFLIGLVIYLLARK